jgi:hypothetical protein
LGRKSILSIENNHILYKCIIKPIWTYDIQLWDCKKPLNKNNPKTPIHSLALSNQHTLVCTNVTIHNELQIPFVIEELDTLSTFYHESMLEHNDRLAAEISNPPNVRRRLRRQGLSNLPQPADEEN